ncbi:hypothetical protein XENTR_v10012036 [Xenopus tropicalis]|nr:hypothetical protein XENTR_v10012036 [Xenopus tropicalis]
MFLVPLPPGPFLEPSTVLSPPDDQNTKEKAAVSAQLPLSAKSLEELGGTVSWIQLERGILLRMAKRLSTTTNTTKSTVYEHFALSSDGKHYVCQCIKKDDDGEKQCDAKISSFSGPDKNAPTRASNLRRHLQRFHPKVLEAVNEKDSNENIASTSVAKKCSEIFYWSPITIKKILYI